MPDGTTVTDTVYLQDASGSAITNAPVTLGLLSGSVGTLVYEDVYGTAISATTDMYGSVTFSVYSGNPGLSVVQMVYESSAVPEGDTGYELTEWARSFNGCSAEFDAVTAATAGETVPVVVYVYQADGVTPVADGTRLSIFMDGGYVLNGSEWTVSRTVYSTDNWVTAQVYSPTAGTMYMDVYESANVGDPATEVLLFLGSHAVEVQPGLPASADVTAPETAPADGTLTEVSAAVYDEYGNLVADDTEITFVVTSGVAGITAPAQTTINGAVSTAVYSTTLGTVTLAVYAADTWLGEATIDFVDTTAPTWPDGSTLTASNITKTSLTLTWTAATDNIGVTGYRIYSNNGTVLRATVGNVLTAGITGLSAGTTYTFTIQARDAAGNWSGDSNTGPSVTVTTSSYSSGTGSAPAPTTTRTVPATGGTVTSQDGKVEMVLPSGAIGGTGTVTITQASTSDEAMIAARAETDSGALAAYKIEIKVNGVAVTRFDEPVTIKIRVPNCGPSIGMYYYDPILKALVPVASTCADGVLSAQITHLTVFLAMNDGDTRFVDVAPDHWAGTHITQLAAKRVVKGVGAHRFEPGRSVTRAEVAKMLVLAAGVPSQQGEEAGDLAGHWARDYVATARAAGAVQGYPDGTVRPDQPVTRAELATMVTRALKLSQRAATMPDAVDHWASGWIGALAEKGVLAGYPDGTFRPDAPVTRAEAAKIIALAFGW